MSARVFSLADARRARSARTRAERMQILAVEHLEEVCRRLRSWKTASQVREQVGLAWRLLQQAENEGM